MTLGETILYHRKKAQLSQEALAELVGVSRQAVSKWELDEATPEVAKLVSLAGAFHITVDQLLSGQAEPAQTPPPAPPAKPDHLSFLGRLIRRYGWLAGVYVALSGAGVAIVGGIARYAFRQMFAVTMGDLFGDISGFGVLPGEMAVPTGISQMGQIFVNIATFIMVLGILTVIAGIVLAIVLWRKGRRDEP